MRDQGVPGIEPTSTPTPMVAGRLWHGGRSIDEGWVRATGVTAVVDLSDVDSHPPVSATSGPLGGTTRLVRLAVPLDADTLPDPGLLLRLAALVTGLMEDGHRVLVHCTSGRNRSGLIVALVVREVVGLSGAEAVTFVRARRPGALTHPAFVAWLRQLPAPDLA